MDSATGVCGGSNVRETCWREKVGRISSNIQDKRKLLQ